MLSLGAAIMALLSHTAAGRQCECLLDYDELDSLVSAVDYLNKVDWSVTSLPALDAFLQHKDGFRIAAFSSKRTSNIEIAVRSIRWNVGPLLLSRTEVAQLRNLIVQAKSKLDALRSGEIMSLSQDAFGMIGRHHFSRCG